jgi:hypothetical protein
MLGMHRQPFIQLSIDQVDNDFGAGLHSRQSGCAENRGKYSYQLKILVGKNDKTATFLKPSQSSRSYLDGLCVVLLKSLPAVL